MARLITIRKLTQGLRRFRVAIPVLLVLAANFPALAQNASFRDRLPANTVFFAEWRGLSTVTSAATKNHVIQLFLDPHSTGPRRVAEEFQKQPLEEEYREHGPGDRRCALDSRQLRSQRICSEPGFRQENLFLTPLCRPLDFL